MSLSLSLSLYKYIYIHMHIIYIYIYDVLVFYWLPRASLLVGIMHRMHALSGGKSQAANWTLYKASEETQAAFGATGGYLGFVLHSLTSANL